MGRVYSIPWFKKYRPEVISQFAEAFKKVALNYKELLPGDKGDDKNIVRWNFFTHN